MRFKASIATLLRWPFHPFALAAFFVLSYWHSMQNRILPAFVVKSLVVSQIASLIVFSVAWLVQRDRDKCALSATLAIYWCMCFSPFYTLMMMCTNEWYPWSLLAVYVGVLCALFFLLFRIEANPKVQGKLSELTMCLNVMTVGLLCLTVVPLISHEVSERQVRTKMIGEFDKQFENIKLASTGAKPDVYYIILDMCAAPETVEEFYGVADGPLTNYLATKGFYLPTKHMSNYDNTLYSLSSSLNMSYLDPIPQALGVDNDDNSINISLIEDNAVSQLFRKLGYKIVNVRASNFEDSDWPKADFNIGSDCPNDVDLVLALATPFACLEEYIPLLHNAFAERRLTPFTHYREIFDIPGPKFVYIHEYMPHPPYLFDEAGRRLSSSFNLGAYSYTPDVYMGQLKFVETKAEELISEIQARSNKKAVIILQSDHGPEFLRGLGVEKQLPPFANERMRILNAYYFPGQKGHTLYPSITPVNSFRVLFNEYFQANMPLLKDRAQMDQRLKVAQGYRLMDVTGLLQFRDAH